MLTSSDDVYDGAEILLLRVYLSFVLYVMIHEYTYCFQVWQSMRDPKLILKFPKEL